jgi:hypothetical protein
MYTSHGPLITNDAIAHVERVPGRQVPDRGLDRVRLAVQPLHDPLQDASPAASSSCTPDGSSRTCPRTR